MYTKLIYRDLGKILATAKKSILLLGPRQVGKSTLIKSLKPDLEINLSNEEEYFRFQSNLSELNRRIEAKKPKSVFIDEIQRIPRLTNTIQALIDENPKLKFYLTGSSARKLRKGRTNLLPGRIIAFQMAPLSIFELENEWNEEHAMSYGCLPGLRALASKIDRQRLLRSYANTYLKEEILAEALVRQIDGFVRFLNVVATESGRYLDFSKMAQKSKTPRQSLIRYFEILEDTLIARKVENDPELIDKGIDLVKHPRFFLFDLGVVNALRGGFQLTSDRIGALFEHLVFNQLENTCKSQGHDYQIYNFRTRGGLEVDFLFYFKGKKWAIECKASTDVSSSELQPLLAVRKSNPKLNGIVIYRGKRELKENGIWILPMKKAFEAIGLG